MEKFKQSDLDKMNKSALILIIMQLYKELEQTKDKVTPHKSGVYMQGTSDTIKNYYDKTLKTMKEGE